MDRLIFEGRFLVNLIETLLKQEPLQLRFGRINWERMFHEADYHRVANIVYLGLLGNGERVPERWQQLFFERYQESLLFGESCEEAEKEILSLADLQKVPCVVLASTTIRKLYPVPEQAAASPLRLYLSPEGYVQMKGYLVDLGYETVESYPEYGEHMRRTGGFCVDIYYKLPFETRFYEKGMRELANHSHIRDGGQSVRTLSAEDRFVFRMAELCYHYVTDCFLLREALDLFLYHQVWRKYLDYPYIKFQLQAFHIDELAARLLQLTYLWFGTKEDKEFYQNSQQPESLEVFDILENRILSRGKINKEEDSQALMLDRLIQRQQEKERRKVQRENFKKRMKERKKAAGRIFHWVFPEYKYMCAIYPILEKAPYLLPFCWFLRGIRLLIGIIKSGNQQP